MSEERYDAIVRNPEWLRNPAEFQLFYATCFVYRTDIFQTNSAFNSTAIMLTWCLTSRTMFNDNKCDDSYHSESFSTRLFHEELNFRLTLAYGRRWKGREKQKLTRRRQREVNKIYLWSFTGIELLIFNNDSVALLFRFLIYDYCLV